MKISVTELEDWHPRFLHTTSFYWGKVPLIPLEQQANLARAEAGPGELSSSGFLARGRVREDGGLPGGRGMDRVTSGGGIVLIRSLCSQRHATRSLILSFKFLSPYG